MGCGATGYNDEIHAIIFYKNRKIKIPDKCYSGFLFLAKSIKPVFNGQCGYGYGTEHHIGKSFKINFINNNFYCIIAPIKS
jgi:hypothetical protein